MTREVDRFDEQAKAIVAAFIRREDLGMITDVEPFIAAALHAAESSALERAAQEITGPDDEYLRKRIRALIPPAAAPEVEDDEPRCNTFGAMGLPSIAPAAETGKAQEAEAPPAFRVTAGDVERLERVYQIGCETMARQGQIAETFRTAHVANEALRLLAARTAPPEGEGK